MIIKVKNKRAISIKLILYLIISAIALTACSSEPEPHIYIALGDSVPSGYGLVSHTDRHTYIFYEMLRKEGYTEIDTEINMAIENYTTADLLNLLEKMTAEQLKLFKSARIITLNIGGNNILVPFSDYLTNNQDSIPNENEEDINSEAEGFREKSAAAWGAIKNTVSDAIETGRALLGFFPPELEAALENGVKAFEDEFIEIIKWIEKHAPKAIIIVNTIYNPVPERILAIPLEISNKADELIKRMNDIIFKESEPRKYFVADVYSGFANESNMMNISQFNLNPFGGFMSIDIIHPNQQGHKIIAELIYEQYLIARETK